jgi:hypothetical protein
VIYLSRLPALPCRVTFTWLETGAFPAAERAHRQAQTSPRHFDLDVLSAGDRKVKQKYPRPGTHEDFRGAAGNRADYTHQYPCKKCFARWAVTEGELEAAVRRALERPETEPEVVFGVDVGARSSRVPRATRTATDGRTRQ